MAQRIDKLKAPPVVGKFYMVPCVRREGAWLPVTGPRPTKVFRSMTWEGARAPHGCVLITDDGAGKRRLAEERDMNNGALKTWLKSKTACSESLTWLGDRDLETAWAECPRGDWLLWLAAKAGIDRKRLVMTACATAREALQFVPAGEDRPRKAIETAEAWCRGEATIEQVREARKNAAYAAADAYAYADARHQANLQMCNIIRSHIRYEDIAL